MKNLIRLKSIVIDKSHIIKIIIKPNKYKIVLNEKIYFSGYYGREKYCIIDISKEDNNDDYDIITNLIKKIENLNLSRLESLLVLDQSI